MTRELTKEMVDWALRVNSEEFKAEARKNQEAHAAAMVVAQAERDRLWAIQRAQYEERQRKQAEAMRPLKEALHAAGIKLQLSSYEGVWGSYQIGDGPVVDIDDDSFDTFEED
jgi:protein-disulfide isomerase-like protein with CxxC motif